MHFNVPQADRYKTGVYIIRNTVDSRVYVGSTKSLRNRFLHHLNALKRGQHPIKGLQDFVNQYSLDSLSFDLVCLCAPEQLHTIEQLNLDAYKSYHEEFGFNRAPSAKSNKGITLSSETRAKISKAVLSRTPEQRDKAINAAREKLTGRIVSAETRAKIGKNSKGRRHSLEARNKMSASKKALLDNNPGLKSQLAEHLKNINSSSSPDTRSKISVSLKGVPKSAATRAKMSEAAKKREQRAKDKRLGNTLIPGQ